MARKTTSEKLFERILILHSAGYLADAERRHQICEALSDLGIYQRPRANGFFTRHDTPRFTALGRKVLDIARKAADQAAP